MILQCNFMAGYMEIAPLLREKKGREGIMVTAKRLEYWHSLIHFQAKFTRKCWVTVKDSLACHSVI